MAREEKIQTPIKWYNVAWRALRPFSVFLCALCLIAVILTALWGHINNKLIAAVDPQSTASIAFTVESGASLSKVSRLLEEAGLIRSKTFFKYYCDFSGFGQKIQAGDYKLSPNMNAFEIANLLTTGDGKPVTMEITVIPGMTVEDVATMLSETGALTQEKITEFLSICKTGEGVEDYYFIQDEKATSGVENRKYLLEGYLAPDTYEIYTDAAPLTILRKLLSQTDKVFDSNLQERMEQTGISLDQTLILASMIEKEAKNQDFAKVSAVFHNRLNRGMKLESDPTIHYITGELRMSLREADLSLNSPYNTYLYKGLPIGPICNPSKAAITAVLYPDESYVEDGYLYFCCKEPDSGELVFSKTLEEHQKAVETYEPLWKANDEQRGL